MTSERRGITELLKKEVQRGTEVAQPEQHGHQVFPFIVYLGRLHVVSDSVAASENSLHSKISSPPTRSVTVGKMDVVFEAPISSHLHDLTRISIHQTRQIYLMFLWFFVDVSGPKLNVCCDVFISELL